MIKQDSGAGEDIITFTIIHSNPVAVYLGHSVGASGIKRGFFALRNLTNLAKHFAARGLVKADGLVHHLDGFQHARYAKGGNLAGEEGLIPGGWDKGLGGEIVNFLRTDVT